jgi:hypothetical protein
MIVAIGRVVRDILAEADAVDAVEDEQLGNRRGDELPPLLSTQHGRLGWLRDASSAWMLNVPSRRDRSRARDRLG